MTQPWPNPWLKGHGDACPSCTAGPRLPDRRCPTCQGTRRIPRTAEQIVQDMLAEREATHDQGS